MMIFPSIFAILVGLGMIGQWSVSFATKQIPELQTEPYRIWFHIAGELVTAVLLVLSGLALIIEWSVAPPIYFVAIGMLLYTAIVSPGYFAQKGQWHWVFIFSLLVILALLSIVVIIRGTI